MGIPIGWGIKQETAKEKDVLRDDVNGQRSPIRRRARSNRSPRSQGAFDTDFFVSSARSPRLQSVSRSSHARTRLAPPPVPEVSRTAYNPAAAGRYNSVGRLPPRQTRDASRARQLPYSGGPAEQRETLDERSLPALTPGFAPATAARIPEAENERDVSEEYFSYLRERSYHRAPPPRLTRSRSPTRMDRSRPARTGYHVQADEDDHESSENNAVSFRSPRYVGSRRAADGPLPLSSLRELWSPAVTVDGLGDRERSESPSDMVWDMYTIVPDPIAPTAESSFASAAASASFSNSHPSSRAGSSNSATSSQTHLTVPSRRDSHPQNEHTIRACDTSEDGTGSDTEEDELDARGSMRRSNAVEAARNRSRIQVRELLRRRIRPSYFSNEPPMRESERYSRRVLERTRDASAYVRSFYNPMSHEAAEVERPLLPQLDGHVEEPVSNSEEEIPPLVPSGSPTLAQEFRDARVLFDRLAHDPIVSEQELPLLDQELRNAMSLLERLASNPVVSEEEIPLLEHELHEARALLERLISEPVVNEQEVAPLVPMDSPPLDHGIRDAQSLLERITRDSESNDDAWASIDLPRSFADLDERSQERERL